MSWITLVLLLAVALLTGLYMVRYPKLPDSTVPGMIAVIVLGRRPDSPGRRALGAAQSAGIDAITQPFARHAGPGHAGDGEEQDHRRREQTDRTVQIAPENAPAWLAAHADNRGAAARPPQDQARDDENHRPARDDFDQHIADRPRDGEAVQLPDR